MRDLSVPDAPSVQPRPGRCSLHALAPAVGSCSSCGRPLCLACAIPVRGDLVGAECLSTVVQDAPAPTPEPSPRTTERDRLALAGFVVALASTIVPWSDGVGGGAGFLGAWREFWSLVAAIAAVAGIAAGVLAGLRAHDARVEALASVVLGLIVAFAAALYDRHPPILTRATVVPIVAALGGALAVLAGIRRLAAAVRPRRVP